MPKRKLTVLTDSASDQITFSSRSHLWAKRNCENYGLWSSGLSGIRIERTSSSASNFFSGAAAYANGRIFMTLTTVGLALKLPQDSRDLLIGNGATPLRYFAKGPIKKDYVLVPKRLANDEERLASWIRESIRFAQTFPKSNLRRPHLSPPTVRRHLRN
jgi:TfoX/Sxy family transcriptional regulator of competence genes